MNMLNNIGKITEETFSDLDLSTSIVNLIQKHAISNPDAVAISWNNQNLSYSELNYRADQLAHYLTTLNVQLEEKIGLYFERSFEIFIAILAVLKVGAAYVPLDPSYPQNRIKHILKECSISITLTQESLLPTLETDIHTIICLDRDWSVICKHKFKNTITRLLPNNDLLAYVLYTSGSTGTPKGVQVNQRSLLNAYLGWAKAYELTSQDVHLQLANFTFDVFSGDFVRALCSGGKLVLCSKKILLNPPALFSLMKTEKVTCAEFVPAVLRLLMEYLSSTQQNLSFMRLLICGSDNWSIGEYKKFKSLCGEKTRLINSYGLTEATIDSTFYEMQDNSENNLTDEDSVPIGKPFPNTTIHILDEKLNPVPKGTIGEMHISGQGLARGYLNMPELTYKKFIELNVENRVIRLYKTGDLAWQLPDGNIQLIGRCDHQVKLLGHRIELTDIENNLNQHPAIIESLVTLQKDKNNRKRLVAYIVLKKGIVVDKKMLRFFLKQHLPTYMIPSFFILINSLPLLSNGKLDRNYFKDKLILISQLESALT